MIYIYKLVDPRSGEPRYVGKTNDLRVRLKTHYTRKFATTCSAWVWSLRRMGLKPKIEVLEEILDGFDWSIREQYWIDQLNQGGKTMLLNSARAGQGPNIGWTHSEITREKLRQKFLGRPISPEQKSKISKTLTGKKQSPETVAKRLATINANRIAKGLNPRRQGEESKAASIKHRNERRQRMLRESGHPVKFSPEWKAKISAGMKRYAASQKKWITPTFEVIAA